MAQLLQTLSIISFAVAGLCLVLAILFWFFFKIPTVVGDLSGKTARKSIAKMRAANEFSGPKSYKESKTNTERGRLTSPIPNPTSEPTTPLPPQPQQQSVAFGGVTLETSILTNNKAETYDTSETTTLSEETAYLGSEETVALSPERPSVPIGGKKLELLEEVMLIHTNEVI